MTRPYPVTRALARRVLGGSMEVSVRPREVRPDAPPYFTVTRREPSASTPVLPRAVVVTVHRPLGSVMRHV